MQVETRHLSPTEEDLQVLAELLGREDEHYRRLLRLAWRQNSYMKRQDVDRLEANSRDWTRYLAQAHLARAAREKFLNALGRQMGINVQPGNISAFLGGPPSPARDQVRALLARIKRTALKLARQNQLNRSLAEFCLDLVQEESEIFKRCVLDDPSGCYGEDARKADRGPGGVLVRQA